MKRIFLIDCPGVVYPSAETDTEKVLKGVVRVELVTNPEDYVEELLKRVRKEYIAKTYNVVDYKNHIDFLEQLAKKCGKLLKGAEPDVNTAAKMMLNDFQRGKLPYYIPPEGFEIPKSQWEKQDKEEAETTAVEEDAETKSVATAISESVLKGRELQQLQDFRKIRVNLDFEPEDIKELDPEELKRFEEQKKLVAEDRKRKSTGDDDESSGISDYYSEDEYDDDKQRVVRRKAGSKIKATPTVTPEKKKQKTASGFFKVEDVASPKPKKKVTAKQRRAADRQQKVKKIGSNFYDVVNVKNKTNSKKFSKKGGK